MSVNQKKESDAAIMRAKQEAALAKKQAEAAAGLKPSLLTHFGYVVGIGVYHTGIEIGMREYCFAGHDYENATGVFVIQPKFTPNDLIFKRSIHMGYTKLSQEEIDKVIKEISNEYIGPSYSLLTRNCNHFSEDLCKRLTGRSIPGWINRAAKLGTIFPCVIPTIWVDPPETTIGNSVTLSKVEEKDTL
ncbi:hypothetical protein G6F62_002411 [Rhizopus arrhizus]|nr:hypothetical protein G6F62_002411 [Rhizopus arrhizus]